MNKYKTEFIIIFLIKNNTEKNIITEQICLIYYWITEIYGYK